MTLVVALSLSWSAFDRVAMLTKLVLAFGAIMGILPTECGTGVITGCVRI